MTSCCLRHVGDHLCLETVSFFQAADKTVAVDNGSNKECTFSVYEGLRVSAGTPVYKTSLIIKDIHTSVTLSAHAALHSLCHLARCATLSHILFSNGVNTCWAPHPQMRFQCFTVATDRPWPLLIHTKMTVHTLIQDKYCTSARAKA